MIGQAAFGADSVDRLIAAGHDVVAVSAPQPEGGQTDPLWARAEELGIPLLDTRRLAKKEPGWLAQFRPDLGVMAFVTAILPARVLETPTHGTIEYHPSLLPRHRGRSAINWAVIQGDAMTGLTIFWVDQGVDTGPVLLRKEVPIEPTDSMGSLYFNKLYPLGLEALVEAVALVAAGKAPRIAQDETLATYEPPCEDDQARIDWHLLGTDVHNLIRGTNPRPGAHTVFRSEPLRIFDVELLAVGVAEEAGVVTTVDAAGFSVGLRGGSLRVLRVQPEGQKKLPAAEWAAAAGLASGDRLGE
ncbi:MAG: methionyl-tRNA formyltransferase [Dehalococcoidia bacterium]